MKINNKDGYEAWKAKNQDPYGAECFRYAEAWADLMESKIAAGAKLVDIAEQTSHEVDTEKITGFMYGMAVKILSKYWCHGEELRVWHNLKIQRHHEGEAANKNGGVLNPAILNIG
jgi:urate oxidase